jgi:mannosyl-oligosaccharide alpha-1,2-mannosidase
MFRYRRYRVFLVFAVIAVIALYKLVTLDTTWREAASTAAGLKNEAEEALGLGSKPRPPMAHETKKLEMLIPAAITSQALQTPPPAQKFPTLLQSSPAVTPSPGLKPSIPTPVQPHGHVGPPPSAEAFASSTTIGPIHWTKLPEKFPVPPNSIIKLPSGKPLPIPTIQHKFKAENAVAKEDRLAKLDKIKSVFKKSWNGYKEFAWLHDELKPLSGSNRDPFASWGATLVDSLDTLWIMGLKEEFEEAAKAVDKIDFTTTPRADIPLFETTIRYLGGLVAAYDLSGKKYKNLLDKAVELAEVLIGAFDTPNRMPLTYYYWRPQFASQKHRADTRAVLAEIGSLSMEFTRLAQITGEHKYYDAIARITDNFEDFQNNTRLPGMWPTYLDASGCGKVYVDPPPQSPIQDSAIYGDSSAAPSPTEELSPEGKKYIPLNLPEPVHLAPNGVNPTFVPGEEESSLRKRQLDNEVTGPPPSSADKPAPLQDASDPVDMPELPECVPQGFVSPSSYGHEEYTLGGMSDSTYEYLPKQYLLLGGRLEQYRNMYEQSMEVVKKYLLFRPMLPNEDDLLFSGKLNVPVNPKERDVGDFTGENAHLTCFAGGMFGMGAKLFDCPEDLEIAKKLTEGCVFSYNMTQTGIMPESFEVVPCKSTKSCAWNETLYWEYLDPKSTQRLEEYKEDLEMYQSRYASASSWYEVQLAAMTAAPEPVAGAALPVFATPTPTAIYADTLGKRQLLDHIDDSEPAAAPAPGNVLPLSDVMDSPGYGYDDNTPTKVMPSLNDDLAVPEPSRTLPAFPYIHSPMVQLSHKAYVNHTIYTNRLPPGVTKVGAKNYILR